MRKAQTYLLAFFLLLVFAFITIYLCDKAVHNAAKGKLFSTVESIPFNKVGLLLGTNKYLATGYANPYFTYRINAAIQLIKSGKIKYVIVSGDNSRKDYDEPEQMRLDLMAGGVDSSRIYLDCAGFRTFDSMVRLREIFKQHTVTVISQPFHNERAIYIASRENIDAIGYNAEDVNKAFGFRVQLREKFARVKLFIDYLFGKKSKYLGPAINIPL